MNPFVYIQMLAEALEDYRWIVEAANACYPVVTMSRIHTAQPNPVHITTRYKMVSEHLLPRPFHKQQFFIGLCQLYRAKHELSPIKSISRTLPTSSPELTKYTTRTSSKTSSTVSHVSDASNTSEISSFSTDNTLSMITTPWTTESWSGDNTVGTFETSSETVTNPVENLTSVTINPASTTSFGEITPELNSATINTVTLLDMDEFKSSFSVNLAMPSSVKLKAKAKSYSKSTFDSWTVESFTSFVEYSDSNTVKVRYPWSPCTYLSGTDIYPDSMDTYSSKDSLMNSLTLDSMTRSIDKLTSSPHVVL